MADTPAGGKRFRRGLARLRNRRFRFNPPDANCGDSV